MRLRLSVEALETMRSLADARGISEAGLLDALLHGLESADQDWLARVIAQARGSDARRRSEDGGTSTSHS